MPEGEELRQAGEVEQDEEEEDEEDEEVVLEAFCSARASQNAGEEEEQDEEEAEADRDQEILQQACLPVSGAPLPPGNGPPKDADEYLRQVQWERLHVPEVVDVEVKERPPRRQKRHGLAGKGGSLLAQFEAPEVPEELGCCQEWSEDVAEAFRQLRSRCKERRRLAATAPAGTSVEPPHLTFDAWRERCACERPSTVLLSAQDFLSVNHLIVVVVDAFTEMYDSMADSHAGDSATPSPEVVGALSVDLERLSHLAEWAFAALAFVDYPLVDDIQYQLQRLRRTCQRLLVAAQPNGSGCSRGMGSAGALQAKANLLVAIVTRVFGQW